VGHGDRLLRHGHRLTRQQLKERAAKDLGVLQPGEVLANEDDDTIDGLVDPLIAQLLADDIVYIDDDDAIDVKYFIPLARLLANMAGPDFGSPVNEDAKKADEGILRRLSSSRPTYAVVKGEFI
jgi:hypothetical protein